MGPWFIRDDLNPYRPGCSLDTLYALIARGKLTPDAVLRGPSTRQFWMRARDIPGVAHLFGECHACHTRVAPSDPRCPGCHAAFEVETDRQYLGLGPIHLLPGQADPATIAAAALVPPPTPRHAPSETPLPLPTSTAVSGTANGAGRAGDDREAGGMVGGGGEVSTRASTPEERAEAVFRSFEPDRQLDRLRERASQMRSLAVVFGVLAALLAVILAVIVLVPLLTT